MPEFFIDEGIHSKNSALSMFIGEQLGSGAYRRVYELKHDPSLVLKLEYCGKEFCNIHEMLVWREVEHTPIEDWFAPCVEIDSYGLVLFQKRTQPIKSEEELKKLLFETRNVRNLPDFFDDAHYANFGIYGGRVVCHDYGFNHFIQHGVKSNWMKLAEEDGQYALGI